MKFYKIILVLLVLFSSCKSSKTALGVAVASKKMSVKKIIRKHKSADFKSKTLDAKLRVAYSNKKDNHAFSVRLKIKKDEVIWLKGTKFITVFKAKITPTEVSYYSPLNKKYFVGSFSVLEELLGIKINFTQLQNMLLGQAIFDIKDKQYSSTIDGNSYFLNPKQQEEFINLFFWINTQHYKLDRQSLRSRYENKTLDISYKRYDKIDDVVFPKRVEIKANKDKENFTNINLDYKSVQFNTVLDVSYKIPAGYKQVVFK